MIIAGVFLIIVSEVVRRTSVTIAGSVAVSDVFRIFSVNLCFDGNVVNTVSYHIWRRYIG